MNIGDIGTRLKNLRGRQTQKEVANYLRVAVATYQGWEKGQVSEMLLHTLPKLSKLYKVSVDYLIYGEDVRKKRSEKEIFFSANKIIALAEDIKKHSAEM